MNDPNILTTLDMRVLFDGYIVKWQDELSYSMENLNKYLTSEEVNKLNDAQADWEKSLTSNSEFDGAYIRDNKIMLGSQYPVSSLLYKIDQYRDRVFHIKYMTYLVENYTDGIISEQKQLWDKFYGFD